MAKLSSWDPWTPNHAVDDFDGDGKKEVAVDFGATGLWFWYGYWTQLSGVNAEFMIHANVDANSTDEVIADFGSIGLWMWNDSAWTKISPLNPD